ncbi:MAG: hypothetical protein IT373_00360 [Polyangiaceae bacterium]|nr:hypothetical protein [Polyangiaceae bacterium]
MRHSLIVALFAALLVPSVAAAQPKGKDKQPRGVILIDVVTITGRIQKPVAAVDVARLRPQLTLSELRQPFLKRIDRAVYDNPF